MLIIPTLWKKGASRGVPREQQQEKRKQQIGKWKKMQRINH
jgi:hypothetical protein